MKSGMWSYIKAAFNARPIGMFIPPNWIGLAGFGMLGVLNPGFWVLGAGLELAYLFGLSSSKRFQRVVDAEQRLKERQEWQKKLTKMIAELDPDDRTRYFHLERRCHSIIEQQRSSGNDLELQTQSEGLGRLLWIYLRLLRTRQAIRRVVRDSIDLERTKEPLDRRLQRLESELQRPTISDDLRRSLFLNFKGGKGVATSAGVALGLVPYYTLPGIVAIAVFLVVFAIFRYVSLGSILAAVAFPLAYFIIGWARGWPVTGSQLPLLLMAALMAAMIVFKHRTNIARLRAGTESRFTTKPADPPTPQA